MAKHRSLNTGLVYSSDHGSMCPRCGMPASDCACQTHQHSARGDGTVRVGRQTKGRKGKGVTVVTGVPLGDAELKQLARELKQKCGSGGTVRDGVIEIQGDHRDALVADLASRGWTVKRSGG